MSAEPSDGLLADLVSGLTVYEDDGDDRTTVQPENDVDSSNMLPDFTNLAPPDLDLPSASGRSVDKPSEEDLVLMEATREEWIGVLTDLAGRGGNVDQQLIDASTTALRFVAAKKDRLDERILNAALQHLRSESQIVRSNATKIVRFFLSTENNPPIDQVVEHADAVAALVATVREYVQKCLLPSDDNDAAAGQPPLDAELEDLIFETTWAITNIASGATAHVNVLIEHDAVEQMINLLSSSSAKLREQAAWSLGNMAGDGPRIRDIVLATKGSVNGLGVEQVVGAMQEAESMSMLRTGAWSVSNFLRGKPSPPLERCLSFLAPLSRLIASTDDEVLTDVCWALSYICDGDDERIQAVVDSGVVPRLVELLASNSLTLRVPALPSVGNICTGSADQTQAAIDAGIFRFMPDLLQVPRNNIVKEACWTLSNITAGTTAQVQCVLDSGVLPIVLGLLETASRDVQKEALWTFSNITDSGTTLQIREIVELGCITPICGMLEREPQIQVVALTALLNILKIGRDKFFECYLSNVVRVLPADVIAKLQEESERHEVAEIATEILEEHILNDNNAFVKSANKQS